VPSGWAGGMQRVGRGSHGIAGVGGLQCPIAVGLACGGGHVVGLQVPFAGDVNVGAWRGVQSCDMWQHHTLSACMHDLGYIALTVALLHAARLTGRQRKAT